MAFADLALLEAAVAIAIPVQELHTSGEPTPDEHRLELVETQDRRVSDSRRPVHPSQCGLMDDCNRIEVLCGSAPSTPHMTDSPFTDFVLFAERQATLESSHPVLSFATAAYGQHEHAGTTLSIDQLGRDEAEEGTVQYSSTSTALMTVARPEGQQQPASGTRLRQGLIDQQVVSGHQEATTAAGSASDNSTEPGEQDDVDSRVHTRDEQSTSAVQTIVPMSSLSPRQHQSVQAITGRSTHACPERDTDSSKTHQSGHLLVGTQSSCQEVKAGATATQQHAVCETEALSSGVSPVDASAPLELGKASKSGHSSHAATAADGGHDGNMQMSEHSKPVGFPLHVPLYPAPLQSREGSGTSCQPAEQAHPPSVIPQPVGSERASCPGLTEGWGAASCLEVDVPMVQTGNGTPESTPSAKDGVLHEAASQLDHQIDIPGDRLDDTEEGKMAAPSVLSESVQELPSLCESREDSGKSGCPGSVTQPDQASSSGSLQVHAGARPQSTSRAHKEPQGQPPQLVQEVLNSLQLSDTLACASQQLLGAMHNLSTSSGTAEAGQLHPRGRVS